jgi:hypothetical protein
MTNRLLTALRTPRRVNRSLPSRYQVRAHAAEAEPEGAMEIARKAVAVEHDRENAGERVQQQGRHGGESDAR